LIAVKTSLYQQQCLILGLIKKQFFYFSF